MLRNLSIRDFALVGTADVEFGSGLTILIGETGAGKSIIIDALSAALGERASADSIRTGARKAIVEATFDCSSLPEVQHFLEVHELTWDSANLIIRRELTPSSASRCFVNDSPVTASVAKELGQLLMDFHGQHDTQGLLNVRWHRELLDSSAQASDLLADMKSVWTSLRAAREHTSRLEAMESEADALRERNESVVRHIATLNPHPDELQQLELDLRRAENSERLISSVVGVRDALTEGSSCAHAQLTSAVHHLRELLPFDASLAPLISELDAAITTCKEAATAAADLVQVDEFDGEKLESMRSRLSALQRLARQYGSLEDALQHRAQAEEELASLNQLEHELSEARARELDCRKAAEKAAGKLHVLRTAAVAPFTTAIVQLLSEMGMPHARVDVRITTRELSQFGSDDVEFLFSANAGEEPRPLQKVASGGELSRFMLALKTALLKNDRRGTVVFDEIDTGISGRVARKVGEVMLSLSNHAQVICITHLAQIASLGTSLIQVVKQEQNGSTLVSTHHLAPEDAETEVAKLLSGDTVTEVALQGARELMGR